MEIKIIGKNSSNKTKLIKNTNRATKNLEGNYEITILESKKIANKYGINNTPALVINERLISQGKVLSDIEITNYIKVLSQ